MDIARIRKKLREARQQEALKDKDKTAIAPAVIEPEPESTGLTASVPAPARTIEEEPAAPVQTTEEKPVAIDETVEAGTQTTEEEPAAPDKAEGHAEAERVVELLIFKLADEDYAFRVSDVHEILRPHRITMVPKTDPFILGITSLRGKIIPVVDIKEKLLVRGEGDRSKIKVLILKGPNGPIGVVVDRGIDVIKVLEGDIMEPPSHLTEAELKFIEGIAAYANRFVSIIRTEGILDLNINGMGSP